MTERKEDDRSRAMTGPLEGLPLPDLEYLPDYERGFWEGARNGELRIQRCVDCRTFRHLPMPACPECHSLDYEWARTSGRGKIYSFLIVRAGAHPAIREKNQTPYNICLVELDDQEGLRIVGNVLNTAPEDIRVDMPVEVVFMPAPDDPEVVLPLFVPTS